MRVLFAGTPAVAIPSLEALDSSFDVVGVLTRPPAPVGRKRVLTSSPVESAARELDLPVYTSGPNDPAMLELLKNVDCVAVVAYGAMIKEPALSIPQHGWINLHFSVLPRWRGAAPVQYAISAGDTHTGMSIFQIEKGLDTGPIYASSSHPITPTDTAGTLLKTLSQKGAPFLVETLTKLRDGTLVPVQQTGQVTHAPTLRTADGQIDWSQPVEVVSAFIRGMTPAPGAWTRARNERYKIGEVRVTSEAEMPAGSLTVSDGRVLVGTGSAPLQINTLAPPGKAWMDASDWARGLRSSTIIFEGTK